MELAAFASFALLVLGWIVAPDRPRPTLISRSEPEVVDRQPIAA